MKLNLLMAFVAFLFSGCWKEPPEYLCFDNIDGNMARLCYPLAPYAERNSAVRNAIGNLADNIEDPGSLVVMAEDMAQHYSRESFEASLKKHFHGLGQDSVDHIVNHGVYSAVLLGSGAALYYNHELQSFVFGYREPTPFGGLGHYFGSGERPIKMRFKVLASNCNLSRDGIVFMSEQKEHQTYDEKGTFCQYGGYYFKKDDAGLVVRKVDQIGLNYSEISAIGLVRFLEWLKGNS